jgi:NAD(P)-dependent dehydrogenase (short-subunit alcohol dehydrogenase family)
MTQADRMKKTILITGGHTGLGLVASQKMLESKKVNLILTGRDLEKLRKSADALTSTYRARIDTVLMDVSSMRSVEEAAQQITEKIDERSLAPLDAIICNAGAMFLNKDAYSDDDVELTFATNYLGHFFLVNLIERKMNEGGRIIFTASGTHDGNTMDGRMIGKALSPSVFELAKAGKPGFKPSPEESVIRRQSFARLC